VEWGNLVIDNTTSGNTDFLSSFRNIKGNLEIRSTGRDACLFTSKTDSIHVGGSLVINGGKLVAASAGQNTVLKVNHEFMLKSGGLYDALPGKSQRGNLEFQPGSKIFLKSGVLNLSGKTSQIILQNEIVNWIQDASEVILPNIIVMPGCTLNLAGSQFGSISENRSLLISPASMISCGRTILTGKGAFRLEPNGTLATAHSEGIFSDTLAGSIQTQKRFFSSSANYVFNGYSSPQKSGKFRTLPLPNTMNQLEVKKERHTHVLILQQDLRVTGRLVIERGSINKNSHRLETGEQETAIAVP
jgi:hypothetical protein